MIIDLTYLYHHFYILQFFKPTNNIMTKLIYFNLYNSVILISFLRIMMTDIYKYIFTY